MSNLGRILTGIAAGVVIGGVAFFVIKVITSITFVSLAFGVVIGLAVAIFLIARSRGEDPAKVAREVASSARRVVVPDDDDMDRVTEELLDIQIKIRTQYGIGDEVRELSERIIDTLAPLTEMLNQRLSGDDLTFETCRIATYHLPRCLKPYFEAGNARAESEGQVLAALRAIEQEVNEIDTLIKDESIEAARHRAGAVKARFADFGMA